ncbi:MAG: PAS domain-containing sensor histidine kinase [Thermodesulfovibrionales bacterium]|nr:PAS domain-containing sensor histidine kinase [Thermodesulfovibrionales bacterium]
MIKQKIYETIVKNLPIGFTTVDEEGITIDFNEAAEVITGFKKEEVIGKSHVSIFHQKTGVEGCPLFRHALISKEPVTAKEKKFVKKSGEVITLLVSVAPLYDSEGKFIGGVEIFRDITDIKRIERERKNILAMFAHDIKNSITTSLGFTSRILSGKSPDLKEDLKIIIDELKTVEHLISEFLEFSKLESKETIPNLEEIDLYQMILKEVDSIAIEAGKKNINISFVTDEHPPVFIKADETMIKRVLINLLDNAVKYNIIGGKITVRLIRTDQEVLVQIEDTGIGIPEDKQHMIFDAFYRATHTHKGSGLGLSIAKQIIELHGGRIWAESVYKKGSTFSFTLPINSKKEI